MWRSCSTPIDFSRISTCRREAGWAHNIITSVRTLTFILLSDCICQDRRRYDSLCCLLSWAAEVWCESGFDQLCCSLLYGPAAGPQGMYPLNLYLNVKGLTSVDGQKIKESVLQNRGFHLCMYHWIIWNCVLNIYFKKPWICRLIWLPQCGCLINMGGLKYAQIYLVVAVKTFWR